MSPQQSESRELDKVIVRLPDGMRDKLKEAASENQRSMNAEIVARLHDSFDPQGLAEIRNQLIAMGRYVSVLERSQKATDEASQATRSVADMYEQHISDLQVTMAEIAKGARIIGNAIASAAEGNPWDLKALVEASNPFPGDEEPAGHMAAFVKVLAANPELSGPFADALKAGNADEAVRLLEAVGDTDATGEALHETRLDELKK